MKKNGIDVERQIKMLSTSSTVPKEIIEFINAKRPLHIREFYETLRKKGNQKGSKLYKNIVKEKQDKKVLKKENYVLSESISNWIEKLKFCDDIINEIKERKEKLCIALSNVDKELNNELHKIELEKSKNACEGYYEYKRIKIILEHRREIKDELLVISHVLQSDYTYLQKESVEKVVNGLSKRSYKFRVTEEEVELDESRL